MFLHVSVILSTGGACVVARGGGMHGCSRGWHAWSLRGGACVVAPGWVGLHGCCHQGEGACMVAPRGGMHGCSWGGVVAPEGGGGNVWLLSGGVRGCCQGACMVAARGACMVAAGGACMVAPGGGMRGIRRDTEIRSMSGRYASYWNAFLFKEMILLNRIQSYFLAHCGWIWIHLRRTRTTRCGTPWSMRISKRSFRLFRLVWNTRWRKVARILGIVDTSTILKPVFYKQFYFTSIINQWE